MIRERFGETAKLFILASAFVAASWFFADKGILLFDAQGAEDDDPPEIDKIEVVDVSKDAVTVKWETDELADSLVNYGLSRDYGVVRSTSEDKDHMVTISGLIPGTTYYFQVLSTDSAGNQSVSGGFHFTTKGEISLEKKETEGEGGSQIPEKVEELTEKEIEQKISDLLEQVKKIETLEEITEKIEEVSQELAEFILVGDPVVMELGSDFAVIGWKTNRDSNSLVYLAEDKNYSAENVNPYTWQEGRADELTSNHVARIEGLKPATLYHFSVSSQPIVGPEVKSGDFTFITKSIKPEIYNIRVQKLEEEAATITWNTNVPATTLINYTNMKTQEVKSAGDPSMVAVHSFRLSGLQLGITYSAIIKAENEYNEQTESLPITFTTVRDEAPPVISKINVESALYPGSQTKIQSIVSWDTDESASCQFFYQEGLVLVGENMLSFPKETGFLMKHTQVSTVFAPATVYKFWLECADKVGNKTKSRDYSFITPQQEKSILDIIIENFEASFGWVKKVGQ